MARWPSRCPQQGVSSQCVLIYLHLFQDSDPRCLRPWSIKRRRLLKALLWEARVCTSAKQRTGLLGSLESSPFRRTEGRTEDRSWRGADGGSQHHQHLLTNDPTSQLLLHLPALLDLLMNRDADSHLTEVRSSGCSFFFFFWNEGNGIIEIQPQSRMSEL